MTTSSILHHHRVVKRLSAPEASQNKTLYFPGSCLGKLVRKYNPARILELCKPSFDKDFEFLCQRIRWLITNLEYNVCLGFDQFVGVEITHHRGLNLHRRDPLTSNFQHVI